MTDVIREGSVITVKPGQDIVSTMVAGFKEEVMTLLGENPTELCVDMTGVEMMDSIGIGVLIAIHNSMKKSGGIMRVLHASDNISKLFKSMRLDQHFNMGK